MEDKVKITTTTFMWLNDIRASLGQGIDLGTAVALANVRYPAAGI